MLFTPPYRLRLSVLSQHFDFTYAKFVALTKDYIYLICARIFWYVVIFDIFNTFIHIYKKCIFFRSPHPFSKTHVEILANFFLHSLSPNYIQKLSFIHLIRFFLRSILASGTRVMMSCRIFFYVLKMLLMNYVFQTDINF